MSSPPDSPFKPGPFPRSPGAAPDSDLVYGRVPKPGSGRPLALADHLVDVAFEDMEPVESFDLIGIEPHTAIAILPFEEFEMIGVAPYGAVTCTPIPALSRGVMADLEPDGIPTEEFRSWDEEAVEAAGF